MYLLLMSCTPARCCTACTSHVRHSISILAFWAVAEHSDLCQIPEGEASGVPFLALKPCLQWTCKLLEMLLSFHTHQQRLTKLALENHKQYQRLLKLLDKQLTNEAAEERDKALDEGVTTKEKMQADRRHVTESYSRASAELGMSYPCDLTWSPHLYLSAWFDLVAAMAEHCFGLNS